MPLLKHQLPVVAALCKHFKTRETVKWGDLDIHPPISVNASVSSGKSLMLAETAKSVREAALSRAKPASVIVMVVQRAGELCSQNSDASWSIGQKNSVFSASCGGRKSTHYQVVYATEGTLARALEQYRFTPYTPEEMAMPPEQRYRLGKCHPDLLLWDENQQVPYEDPDSQALKIIRHFYLCKPHMRFAGFGGSPFRGVQSIIGDTAEHLWRKVACIEPSDPDYPEGAVGNGIISTEWMIENGWVTPPMFGYPDEEDKHYSFDHLEAKDWQYDEAQLDEATSDRALCLSICQDVIDKTKERKGVLVFASTQRHARMIAAAFKMLGVPDDKIGVVTEKTRTKDRAEILSKAKTGAIKFTINVAVLTVGVNVPYWDSLVYMRPVGSLVLLIQSIGRVLRLLIEDGDVPMLDRNDLTAEERRNLIAASNKPDALVLDYAGVMDTLGHLYANPVLEMAELAKAKKDNVQLIECPQCATMNSPHARRCIGGTLQDRCDWFWHYRACPSCHTKNDQVARECRNQECRRLLIDPNAALSGKHYTEGESIPVRSMRVETGRGGKLIVRFELSDGRNPQLIYYPHAGKQPALNSKIWKGFVKQLPIDDRSKFRLGAMKAETIVENLDLIPVPAEISAREKNGKWVVGRMKFAEAESFMEPA